MIVPMKKVTLIVTTNDREKVLVKLGEIGILHVQSLDKGSTQAAEDLKNRGLRIKKALNSLSKIENSNRQITSSIDPEDLAIQILTLKDSQSRMRFEIKELKKNKAALLPSCDCSPDMIPLLRRRNIFIRLYISTEKRLREISIPSYVDRAVKHAFSKTSVVLNKVGKCKPHYGGTRAIYKRVGRRGKEVIIAVISRDPNFSIPLKELPFPKKSLVEADSEIQKKEYEYQKICQELEEVSRYRIDLLLGLSEIQEEIEVQKARDSLGSTGTLDYIQGFCPKKGIGKLRELARENSWGLVISEPSPKDTPPTLIQNPKWVRIIEPVFKMIKTLPGYNEYDISLWFLVYLGIFFAILIGDAGYGLVFLVATAVLNVKYQDIPRDSIRLAYVFSTTTLLWGTLTGNWFGIEAMSQHPALEKMAIPSLNAFTGDNQSVLMLVCFIIGASHLSVAHLIACVRAMNSLKALAEIGWVLIVWGIFFVIRKLILGAEQPTFSLWILAIGAVLVILFASPHKNMMKQIGAGLGNFVTKAVNCFSDIISYIRLFAVGMATVAVAASFNEIAYNLGFGSIVAGLGSALILALGHGLNIVMAALAVVVHGVRLNMLEFSSHLGMQWSGIAYRPFKRLLPYDQNKIAHL